MGVETLQTENRREPNDELIRTVCLLNEIATGLATISSCDDEYPSNVAYTDCVVKALADIGKKRNYKVHPDPGQFHKEYLFDASWWRESDSYLALAAESEWGRWGDVAYDFPKLLIAKAPLKVLITDSGCHGGSQRNQFKRKLEGMLRKYPWHVPGERYIWVDVQGKPDGGELLGFECNIASDGRCPNEFVDISSGPITYIFSHDSNTSTV